MEPQPPAQPPAPGNAEAPQQEAGTETIPQPQGSSPFSVVDTAGEPDCPACGWGILFAIGKTEDGTIVHCFNCGRGMSVPDSGEVPAPAVAGVDGPTAMSPTHQQVADAVDAHPAHPVQDLHGKTGQGVNR
jgi:hypothetical protein